MCESKIFYVNCTNFRVRILEVLNNLKKKGFNEVQIVTNRGTSTQLTLKRRKIYVNEEKHHLAPLMLPVSFRTQQIYYLEFEGSDRQQNGAGGERTASVEERFEKLAINGWTDSKFKNVIRGSVDYFKIKMLTKETTY